MTRLLAHARGNVIAYVALLFLSVGAGGGYAIAGVAMGFDKLVSYALHVVPETAISVIWPSMIWKPLFLGSCHGSSHASTRVCT